MQLKHLSLELTDPSLLFSIFQPKLVHHLHIDELCGHLWPQVDCKVTHFGVVNTQEGDFAD